MKLRQTIRGICLVVLAVSAIPAIESQKKGTAEYKLVWADEFDKDGRPDPKKWTYETGFVRNRELQWYQPDNAFCRDGMLIIEGRRESKVNPSYDSAARDSGKKREHAQYTSASLITKGLHSWQYGRFEMRGRIDTRPGLWPAFWTLGVEGRWPHNGEIDIMEYYRGMLLANVAWGGKDLWKAIWDDTRTPIADLGGSDWAKEFHIWRMDWDQDSIELYMDNRLLNSTRLSDTINQDAEGKNPFHQPHYILLNLAIGGTNGGDPSGTQFPSRFEVDYVRVFQRE